MNAAAKAINENNLFNGQLFAITVTKELRVVFILLFCILVSAIALVYTINESRSEFSDLQQLHQQAHNLQLQWGQLMLEQASLATPERVEQLAVYKLKMHLPSDQQTFLLQP